MVHWPGSTGGHGFEFPQTGIYTIESTHRFRSDLTQANSDHYIQVQMSNDSSNTWQTIKEVTAWHPNQSESSSQLFHTLHGKTTVRITNTTTERVRFKYNTGTALNALVGGNSAHSYAYFTRSGELGDKGAKGEKGEKGQKGEKGLKGQKGNQPTGYGGTGSYTFAALLTGSKTSWASNSDPPSGITYQNFGSGNTFSNCEFIKVGAYCAVNITSGNHYFPDISSSNILTPSNTSRQGHNFPFGYVIPADGKLLGFSIDFIKLLEQKLYFILLHMMPQTKLLHFWARW